MHSICSNAVFTPSGLLMWLLGQLQVHTGVQADVSHSFLPPDYMQPHFCGSDLPEAAHSMPLASAAQQAPVFGATANEPSSGVLCDAKLLSCTRATSLSLSKR